MNNLIELAELMREKDEIEKVSQRFIVIPKKEAQKIEELSGRINDLNSIIPSVLKGIKKLGQIMDMIYLN